MRAVRIAAAGIFALTAIVSIDGSGQLPRPQPPSAVRPPNEKVAPELLKELRWRHIGPFRGGRTKAGTGVPSQPGVFYIGAVNGGVWKTIDYGRTWVSLFDDQPTGSIGAIAVAPSNPDRIYVGSGEGMQRPDLSTGDGVYRSNDGGTTWSHLGLRDGQQITRIIVDPRDENRLFVAVLGHPYGPNRERGIFRSIDGGTTFQPVLYKDENTGGADLAFDPKNPDTVYAALWEARQGPWENAEWRGPGSGLFKSTDGGTNWKPLTKGFPTFAEGLGRIGIAVAPGNPRRLYAVVEANRSGLYRSDDAGESWTLVCDDQRVVARPDDANEIGVDPKNPDVVYVPTIVTWKSTDAGRTFFGLRGAPGGDDYQSIWINPSNPDIMLLTADQGAIVTTNGGLSWSSWYNQPTAQMFHVSADNSFPYRVCGGQQESGSACVQSRGDSGQITFRDWQPVAAEEYGYAVPDPLNPNLVYGGKLTRFDRRTGQAQNVAPKPLRGDNYRVVRTAPIVFSPADPHVLFFASNTLWRTLNGGQDWVRISGDLTRKTWEPPASVGKYRPMAIGEVTQRGVIYAVAPSPLWAGLIWAGTDDGLIHVTADGGLHWKAVTPTGLEPWAKVSIIEASHFDPQTAYAAIDTMRLDDMRPHIYRTRNGGQTWTHITDGIPNGGIVRVVREDPMRRGLLFAGTEQAVYVSFDDGDNWQPLRLNMPATSVRDLVVKGDDLVVATHGRGFWILDDITPLRQMSAKATDADAFLFKPQQAWRYRWNQNTDTPLPPDEPAGQNPPEGAIIHYYLRTDASQPVTIEIHDAAGALVRRYSSADPIQAPIEGRNIPDYWIRPPQRLSTSAGLHRFTWDLRCPPPAVGEFEYPIAAVVVNTTPEPRGPWVLPGVYTVRLTVAGKSYSAPLTVKMDPRVTTPVAGLQQQFALSMRMYDGLKRAAAMPKTTPGLEKLRGSMTELLRILQEADATPTSQAVAAVAETERALAAALKQAGSAPAVAK